MGAKLQIVLGLFLSGLHPLPDERLQAIVVLSNASQDTAKSMHAREVKADFGQLVGSLDIQRSLDQLKGPYYSCWIGVSLFVHCQES